MSRRLAAAAAVAAAVGVAIAIWSVVASDAGPDSIQSPELPTTDWRPAARAAPETVRFTVSVSGDLLMHSPLLDRALANGGGDEYDFAPFFDRIAPFVGGADLALCHLETPLGAGAADDAIRSSTHPPVSRHRSGAAAGTRARPPPTTRSTRAWRGSARPRPPSTRTRIAHTGSFASAGRREAADDPPGAWRAGRLRLLHRRDQRHPGADRMGCQRVPGGRPGGGSGCDSRRRAAGPAGGRGGGDRERPLGRRVREPAERVAARGREATHRLAVDHRGRRPGPARGPADPAPEREVRRSSARATSSPTRARRPASRRRARTG